MSHFAFNRYAPFIQAYIYKKQWTDLREVQVEACEAILDTDNHVIVASGTASGKTEAAFFPILTALEKDPSKTIGVMYIGPLKALINDQFERLSGLLEDTDIPVFPWHGDVSASIKKRAMKTASGVLQITPESLEAMLMRHPGEVADLFADLRFVVIDEIHALMGVDRGLQLNCLLTRLERLAKCKPRRIGLSATLNDYEPALTFLSAGSEKKAIAVGTSAHKRTISLCVESFIEPENPETAPEKIEVYNQFLYENCHLKKCLIFANSRSETEKVIANMKSLALEKKERDIFFVHHGSVASSLRQEAETALRDSEGPIVTAATLTLELGIDIGDLDATIQVGAPYTCASFVQRLGRSGRRTGISQMMFVNVFKNNQDSIFSFIPWELLRSIAIIQLYAEERWVEPFSLKQKPYSLLVHQTLSTLMTYGELAPSELARSVLTLPVFSQIPQDEYRLLLQNMLAENYLERMDSGELIIGLKGERLANHYTFYAVFQEEESYKVESQNGTIGTLDHCPTLGEVFTLAGRSWKVDTIDEGRKNIFVTQVTHSKIPMWNGSTAHVHTRVVERMKSVLLEDKIYPYLQPGALELLSHARKQVSEKGLFKNNLIVLGEKSYCICPFTGSKELTTIKNLLAYGLKETLGIVKVTEEYHYLNVTTHLEKTEFLNRLKTLELDVHDPSLVLDPNQTPLIDKFDPLVPEGLLRKAALYNNFDVPNAIFILKAMTISD